MAKFIGIMIELNPTTGEPTDKVTVVEKEFEAETRELAQEFLSSKYYDELDYDWLFYDVHAIQYPTRNYGRFEPGPLV